MFLDPARYILVFSVCDSYVKNAALSSFRPIPAAPLILLLVSKMHQWCWSCLSPVSDRMHGALPGSHLFSYIVEILYLSATTWEAWFPFPAAHWSLTSTVEQEVGWCPLVPVLCEHPP